MKSRFIIFFVVSLVVFTGCSKSPENTKFNTSESIEISNNDNLSDINSKKIQPRYEKQVRLIKRWQMEHEKITKCAK